MGKINYYQWLNGGCGCQGGRVISGTDVCDCDQILLEISNLHTDDEVLQDEIDDLSGVVATISGGCDCDLTDYYTKQEVDDLIPEVPSLSGYATEQWVENKNYLTEHQPLKTINGQVISGTGNIVIEASGGSVTVDEHLDLNSTNPAQNKAITEALNGKLDASAYTPTEQVQSDWNESDTDSKAYIKNKPVIPTVPTSNSAFTNDMHYVTSAETANYVTSGNVETQIVNHFWCGTQTQYDQLPTKQNNVLYLIHE